MTMTIESLRALDACPEKGETALCAVSGGADSMYLLCRMAELGEQHGFSVACAHFNHGLRGAEADRDEAFVRSFCAERAIPFYAGRGDTRRYASEMGLGIEAAARALRYAFLEKTAGDIGAGYILTAHTADDNAETVLLNLARGSGARGLGGIAPRRGRLVRPMLETTRSEVEAYLQERQIPHVEDATNAQDDYARNLLRHRAVPVLRQVNSAFSRHASRSAALLRQDEDCLCALARDFVDASCGGGRVPVQAFLTLHAAVGSRVLRMLAGEALEQRHVAALYALCAGENGKSVDIPGVRVVKWADMLFFGVPEAADFAPVTLQPEEEAALEGIRLRVRCRKIENCREIHNSFNTFFFKYANICGRITVRPRKAGDTIRLLGHSGTKSVKKLFQEARVPPWLRNAVPVVADEAGVLALYRFGAGTRCAAQPGDTVLRLTFEEM